MSTIYYTATSLDGFLADDEDDISYLDAVPQPSEDTYTPFIANVGSICMGSATYDFLLRHIAKGNAWLYPNTRSGCSRRASCRRRRRQTCASSKATSPPSTPP
jgi:hypothetical protein